VADDIQIWSESFDRSAKEPLEVQSEIAGAVVRQVGVLLLGWEGEDVLQALLEDQEVALPVPETEPAPSTTTARGPSSTGSQPPAVGKPSGESGDSMGITGETAPEVDSALQGTAAGAVFLNIRFTSRVPDGVLTLYADEEQILKEQFRYEKKSRLLRPKRPLGGFETTRKISSDIRSLRIYLLVDGESKLTTLRTELLAGETRTLSIEVLRKGAIEASLE
jgi:hypothetical protein